VKVSGSGCVGSAGGRPAIRAGIVSASGVQCVERLIKASPDDHFTASASPHCRVSESGSRSIGSVGGRPAIGAGVVSPAGVKNAAGSKSAPDLVM
jgi:hypothetical protein